MQHMNLSPVKQASVLIPALVILIGLLLRIALLGVDVRFHPDEALFAAQARLITDQGDWLLRTTDLDKPPLTIYTTAFAFATLTPSEFAARLPNVLFSGLSVALLFALVRTIYRDRITAIAAALLLALAPYDLAFAATTFTDVQATFWGLAACTLAVRDRWTLAGIAAGLMFAAKSTGLLMLPIILALGITQTARSDWRLSDLWHRARAFALPFVSAVILLLVWDAARAPRSFFNLGYTRNQPGRFIRSDELLPRLDQWGHWLGYLTGSRALNAVAAIAIPAWLLTRLRQGTRANLTDWLIAGYSMAFLGWHWLVAFNTYDRYLHMVMPFIVLLAARALVGFWRSTGAHRVSFLILLAVVAGGVAPAVADTLRGDAAIGGDQGQHTGIDVFATYLNMNLDGATIYDHWLGWELAYYLGPEPRIHLHYIPRPAMLAADVQSENTAQYFAAPSPYHAAPWIAALEQSGIRTRITYHDKRHGFVLYRLLPSQ